MSEIISFYSEVSPDNRGRTLGDMLQWDFGSLESVHDYIQWLFPLDVRSAYNWNAPTLTQIDISEFRNSPQLQGNLRKAFLLMLKFYGFTFNGERIVKSDQFDNRAMHWLYAGNHNMLRITRILKSLTLLGLGTSAQELFTTLDSIYKEHPTLIGNSYGYWKNAIAKP